MPPQQPAMARETAEGAVDGVRGRSGGREARASKQGEQPWQPNQRTSAAKRIIKLQLENILKLRTALVVVLLLETLILYL